MVEGWAKTQPTVAQSACAAEFIGANVDGKEALGYANILEPVGMVIKGGIYMVTDASAAMGVSKCPGVGKLRHLHVFFFVCVVAGAG